MFPWGSRKGPQGLGFSADVSGRSCLGTLRFVDLVDPRTPGEVADRTNQPRVEDSRKLEGRYPRFVAADGLGAIRFTDTSGCRNTRWNRLFAWVFCANRFLGIPALAVPLVPLGLVT
jgi:hypothetical protein